MGELRGKNFCAFIEDKLSFLASCDAGCISHQIKNTSCKVDMHYITHNFNIKDCSPSKNTMLLLLHRLWVCLPKSIKQIKENEENETNKNLFESV